VRAGSGQAENGCEGLVDSPDLFDRKVSDAPAQALNVDSSKLLDEHARDFASYRDLGAERSWSGAA
jgi:hypothetical protein